VTGERACRQRRHLAGVPVPVGTPGVRAWPSWPTVRDSRRSVRADRDVPCAQRPRCGGLRRTEWLRADGWQL